MIGRVAKSFADDVLLALSCREAGCVLVAGNDRDFSASVGTWRSISSSPGVAGYCPERRPIAARLEGRTEHETSEARAAAGQHAPS